ncbi:unnamed protein product [Rotaria socialis]|uniref:ETS domain-containing protein n=1 Tax=Rotaria socialis TaxID=392032 RepID=A0A821JJR8_9BILA|nr:unnamed protein product [Rotaria socialis]CAF3743337.1 unnamed protein product [Rotaria socialis]CAF3801872.1 unnamed protein product [Rotaria socialis]CAF4378085.1 unnamed protein product [Rotaria socialis]CAF4589534.1 unnamed protein product [Rotaria socialis]
MEADSVRINELVRYLKDGIVNTDVNDSVEYESHEPSDDDECQPTSDCYTTDSSSQDSSIYESDVPFDLSEWLIIDSRSNRRRSPLILEFLRLLLEKPRYSSYASYTNSSLGIFQIYKPNEVATLWARVRSRQSSRVMSYDKFARAIRHYYQYSAMIKTNSRYTFQFGTVTSGIEDRNNHTS